MGTAGIVIALAVAGAIFFHAEAGRLDVKSRIEAAEVNNRITLPLDTAALGATNGRVMALTVAYSYGHGEHLATVLSDVDHPVLEIAPEAGDREAALVIVRALYGPVPAEKTGWMVAGVPRPVHHVVRGGPGRRGLADAL